MKTLIGALALVIAAPVAAQTTAPATDPHAQHTGTEHSQHEQGKHDCKACCEKMKGKDGKMDCRNEKSAGADQSKQGHEGHAH